MKNILNNQKQKKKNVIYLQKMESNKEKFSNRYNPKSTINIKQKSIIHLILQEFCDD